MRNYPENLLLSVVTVNFNNAVGLHRTARSLSKLGEIAREWIVIDGGSTDDSTEIAKKHGVDKLISERDGGIYDAMNKGIRLAAGEYIWFVNSGDEIGDINGAELANCLGGREMLVGNAIYVDGGSSFLFRARVHSLYSFVRQNPFCHQSIIYKRSGLEGVGVYELKFRISSDFDLTLRYMLKFGAKNVPMVLSYCEADGVSSNRRFESLIDRMRSLKDNAPITVYLVGLASFIPIYVRLIGVRAMEVAGVIGIYRRLKRRLTRTEVKTWSADV